MFLADHGMEPGPNDAVQKEPAVSIDWRKPGGLTTSEESSEGLALGRIIIFVLLMLA